ncbi:MAG: hypothetical protein ABIG46_00705 [Candidatus Omnitrophota bacterium]|nr:hypothetical protein [Candidatus Omnitrophota bacterium]
MKKIRAQSSIEYTFLACLVCAALLTTAVYTRRSMQGRMKYIAEDYSGGNLYAPGKTSGDSSIVKDINEGSSTVTITDFNDRSKKTTYANSTQGLSTNLGIRYEDTGSLP